MSQPPITCRVDASLNEAARLMWEHDCGSVPVVDGDGKVAGIVTDRDICMAAYTQGERLTSIPVTTAMAKSVVCCHADDEVESAESVMGEQQVRRLPVVDAENHPVGLLSLNDVAQEIARSRAPAGGLQRSFVSTVGAICRPRASEAHAPATIASAASEFAASAH
jgi:predicted transcriptional regulator